MEPEPTEETRPKSSIVRKIWALLDSAERRSAVVVLGLMLIGMVLETLGVGLILPALALLTRPDLAGDYPVIQPFLQALGNPSRRTLVIGSMLVLVLVYLVKALFLGLLAWRQARFAFGLQARVSQSLFAVYLRQPYTFHLQRNSAQLIRNVITEVSQLTVNGVMPGMLLLTELSVLLGLFGLLLAVEPLGALGVMSVLGMAAWGFQRFTGRRIARWGKERQHHDGLRIQHLQQGLGGAKDVKLLGRETDFLEQYRMHNVASAQAGQLHATVQQLPRLWLELLTISGLAILVMSMLAQGRAFDALLPTLGLFTVAAFRLIPSVNRVLGAMQSLRYGLPVIDVLSAELSLDIPEETGARGSATPFQKALELSNISFSYPLAARPSIRGISLVIECGESVGFVGATGAGKTTLLDIVLGLLTPDAGEVRVDGRDIQEDLRNWQDQIGHVPQSIFLTDDTLRRNVAFGLSDEQIDDDAVRRAIKAAQLDEFVANLTDGLETQVGERGIRLSGGQRQRIGIARALYHDPSVLVLDEATSSLDTATEREVMRAVTALQGSKTIIIVAHRPSTVQHCDRVYLLDEGRLAEEGTPASIVYRDVEPGAIPEPENIRTS